MGFNKRIYSKDVIEKLLASGQSLKEIFSKPDALFFRDDWSLNKYDDYIEEIYGKHINDKAKKSINRT